MTATQVKIEPRILTILAKCSIEGNKLTIPGQLDRPTYISVNRILDLMGGKWTRAAKAHIFPEPPDELLETVLLTAEITDKKKLFQAYYTPAFLAARVAALCQVGEFSRILDPSAGEGALLAPFRGRGAEKVAVELDRTKEAKLLSVADRVHIGVDFLGITPADLGGRFDAIAMNPPFSGGQDIRHITHASHFLKPAGLLVAICARGPKQEAALMPHVEFWEALPGGTFDESGTGVNTALMVIRKPLSPSGLQVKS